MIDQRTHDPVMLEEVLEHLALEPGAVVVDGTVGLGGHSLGMAARIATGGVLLALDWDEQMLDVAKERLSKIEHVDVRFFHCDYRRIPQVVTDAGLTRVDAILLDMGLNNAQLEDESRGMSFRRPGPLDMRMDRSSGQPASELVNEWSAAEIETVLHDYGDENWAKKIAEIIVDRRKLNRLETTDQLVDCVLAAIPAAKRQRGIHPATRTFQAIRIAVNGELEGLIEAVEQAARCLSLGGRMVVLTYHSGEDRAVKRAFRSLAESEEFSLPFKKPQTPSQAEVARNPKSRSAKLRAIHRVRISQEAA